MQDRLDVGSSCISRRVGVISSNRDHRMVLSNNMKCKRKRNPCKRNTDGNQIHIFNGTSVVFVNVS